MYYSGLHKAIKELEEKKFYDIALLFLATKGYQDPVIKDGTGDGGRDVVCSNWPNLRIQLSIQKDWESKINKEASLTKSSGHEHFVYITNRRIKENEKEQFLQERYKFKDQVNLTIFDLDSIATSLSMPGAIGAAYEKLGIIYNEKLTATTKEIAISSVLLFSKEAKELRDNVIENSLKAHLLENPDIPEDQLFSGVAQSLHLVNTPQPIIQALQRLRSTGTVITKNHQNRLSQDAAKEMDAAKEDFLKAKAIDINNLSSKYAITEAQANSLIGIAIEILARKSELDGSNTHAAELANAISQANLGRKKKELYDDLSKLSSARVAQFGDAIDHIFSTDTFDIFRVLGRSTSISAILDSSVSMPMLFGLSFSQAKSRYGIGATGLRALCEAHQIKIKVPRPYLNEMAFHGKRALEYIDIYNLLGNEPRKVLKASGNAYISHFSHIRDESRFSNLSLQDFLGHFGLIKEADVVVIENRLEELLSTFGIEIQEMPRWTPDLRTRIQAEKPNESRYIIDHDASVLTYFRNTSNVGFIFATWDNVMMRLVESISRIYADSPSRVVDFLSMSRGAVYESDQTISLLDSLIYCDEKKSIALANKLEAIRTTDVAYEIQRFTDEARRLNGPVAASEELVENYFEHHKQTSPQNDP